MRGTCRAPRTALLGGVSGATVLISGQAVSYPHFRASELACKCLYTDCLRHAMDDGFMQRLERLRDNIKISMPVTSAYRCPKHNLDVSTTGPAGPHTTGRAIDIRVCGEEAFYLVEAAFYFGFTGVGLMQHGPSPRRFVHLDDLSSPDYPRPRVWSY